MRPLRLGLLGTGIAARKLYWPALKNMRHEVRLLACANRTRSKAEAFAGLSGAKVVADAKALFALPELDAVLISLPIDSQPAYIIQALKAGKAVLSEKPMAPSLAAGRRLLERARPFSRRGPLWMVGENLFFMPAAAWIEELLCQGALGDLRLVEVRQSGWTDESVPYFHTAWRRQGRFVGGFVLDSGVHLAHVLRRLLGAPKELHGLSASFNPGLPPIDSAVAVMRFSGGALGSWLSSFSNAAGGPQLALRGSKGSAELYWDHAVYKPRQGRERVFRSKVDSFTLQFRHFARAVLQNKKPAYTPAGALADLAFMESVVRGRILRP
ncbi:MAG TPA: Gfo/Idh/MocA family oxidoreductase [bacterium]|jgi:predicted dehydrogenase|nr:Gfo/Idh/MocA family oxidoreductase [bacterium]